MIRSLAFLVLLASCADPGSAQDAESCDPVALEPTWTGPSGSVLTIIITDPDPPARFTNWWSVTIDDPDGAPMTDPTALEVSAFMPEHGHATPTTPDVTAEPDALAVGPIELWMPGRWEVRFDVPGDRIVVPVCVAE